MFTALSKDQQKILKTYLQLTTLMKLADNVANTPNSQIVTICRNRISLLLSVFSSTHMYLSEENI
jgi:hypothetical protein